MKIDRYVLVALALTAIAIGLYAQQFWSYELSDDPNEWAQLGDYIGGTLNPILSFASVLLIVRSLDLQRLANNALQKQISESQRTELTRAFEAKFYGMLKVQSENFSRLAITKPNGEQAVSADAVIWIEAMIENIRSRGGDDAEVLQFLEQIDTRDQLYGLLRGFYVTVKFIINGLSDPTRFEKSDRELEITNLINFSDFALVRLYKMMMQFTQSPAALYLGSCEELGSVMHDLGLDAAHY